MSTLLARLYLIATPWAQRLDELQLFIVRPANSRRVRLWRHAPKVPPPFQGSAAHPQKYENASMDELERGMMLQSINWR